MVTSTSLTSLMTATWTTGFSSTLVGVGMVKVDGVMLTRAYPVGRTGSDTVQTAPAGAVMLSD